MNEIIILPNVRHEYSGHPAKLHQELARVLILDYTRPGDLVLDPFAGIGTVPRVATRNSRLGVGVEIEEKFVSRARELGTDLIHGNSLDVDFGQPDLILTSPPYGEMIGRAGDRSLESTEQAKRKYELRRFGRQISPHSTYGITEGNLGSLPFHRKTGASFTSLFPTFVARFSAHLKPGGRLVMIVKDQRLGRSRLGSIDMFAYARECAETAGLVYEGRRVAVLPECLTTQWQRVNEQRWGIPIPNAEHICVMRKIAPQTR